MEMRLLLSPQEKKAIGEKHYFSVSVEGIHTKDAPDKHSFGRGRIGEYPTP